MTNATQPRHSIGYNLDECLDWITSQMDKGLIVPQGKMFNKDNEEALQIVSKIDRTYAMKKNLCSYQTTGHKQRWVHANRLCYLDKNGELCDSGITRTETPYKVKAFYSWLMQKRPHVFNLVHNSEQIPDKGYVKYIKEETEQGELNFQGKKGRVSVDTTYLELKETMVDYTVNVKKYSQEMVVAQMKMKVTQYDFWEDGGDISIEDLLSLAEAILDAKQKMESPVVHCLAGKGRTGTLVAASIILEDVKSKGQILGLDKTNYKYIICKLIADLRNNGGGESFVQTSKQLELLFNFAKYLLK